MHAHSYLICNHSLFPNKKIHSHPHPPSRFWCTASSLISPQQHQKQLEMRAISSGVFWSLLILLFSSSLYQLRLSKAAGVETDAAADMVPLVEPGKVEMMVMVNESRRKLGSFQICSLCTCCGGASRSYCLPSPCCYAINCNIPNRPFGFCSFTPKTCNCFGCHI